MLDQTRKWAGIIIAALLFATGCGGGNVTTQGSTTLSRISLSLSPTLVTVPTGTIQAFTVTLNNAPTESVSWEVNGISGGNTTYGTIDKNGNYTAPLYTPYPATFQVTAF